MCLLRLLHFSPQFQGKLRVVFHKVYIKQQEIHCSDTQHTRGYVSLGHCSRYTGFLKPLLLETPQPHWAACSSTFIALALVFLCTMLSPCPESPPPVLSAGVWRTSLSVNLCRSIMLIPARAGGQPARWDSHGESQQESDGFSEFLFHVLQ